MMDVLHDPRFYQKVRTDSADMTMMQKTNDYMPAADAADAISAHNSSSTIQRSNNLSLVMTNSIDENWGFFSTKIHTRTGKWLNMTNHLKIHGSSYETVQAFLSHPSILLVGTGHECGCS